MLTVEGKSGLGEVIEVGYVDGPDVTVATHMLGVADRAVSIHLSVDSFLVLDPVGDFGMTAETFFVGHTLAGIVALLAVVQTFQLGMGLTQGTGRKELAELLTADRRRQQPDGKNHQAVRERLSSIASHFLSPRECITEIPDHGDVKHHDDRHQHCQRLVVHPLQIEESLCLPEVGDAPEEDRVLRNQRGCFVGESGDTH